MGSELAEMMFDVLSKRIGEEVVCSEWHYGMPTNHEGVLENVVPFDNVVIDKNIIPFVGDNWAIEQIVLKSTQNTVYSNPQAVSYDRKGSGVILAQQEMLGYSVKRDGAYKEKEETVSKYR